MTKDYYLKEIIDTNHKLLMYFLVNFPTFDEMKKAQNNNNYLSEKAGGALNEGSEITQELCRMSETIRRDANDFDLEQLIGFTVLVRNKAIDWLKIIKDIVSEKEGLNYRLTKIQEERNRSDNNELNELRRKNDNLQREKTNLERELNDWRTKFNDKNRENEDNKEKLKQEKRGRQNDKERYNDDKLTWTRTEGEKNTEIAGLKTKLRNEEDKVKSEKRRAVKLEDKLEERNREIRELNRQLGELRTNNENLRERAGQSREELLTGKIRLKRNKLEIFAIQIGINLQQVDILCRYCERLVHAQKNCNQANIETHESNIAGIKEELRQRGLQVENIQKFCDKCEKIAKMRVELNEIRQQQYEARQELPPLNNNNRIGN